MLSGPGPLAGKSTSLNLGRQNNEPALIDVDPRFGHSSYTSGQGRFDFRAGMLGAAIIIADRRKRDRMVAIPPVESFARRSDWPDR